MNGRVCGHSLRAARREGWNERRALIVELAAGDTAIARCIYDGHAPRTQLRKQIAQVAGSQCHHDRSFLGQDCARTWQGSAK